MFRIGSLIEVHLEVRMVKEPSRLTWRMFSIFKKSETDSTVYGTETQSVYNATRKHENTISLLLLIIIIIILISGFAATLIDPLMTCSLLFRRHRTVKKRTRIVHKLYFSVVRKSEKFREITRMEKVIFWQNAHNL